MITGITKIKTAISINKNLFEKIEQIAKELNMSRSQIFSSAVEYLIEKKETSDLVKKINEVYEEDITSEDEDFIKMSKNHFLHILRTE